MTSPSAGTAPRSRRRWWIVGCALLSVIVVVVTVALLAWWRQDGSLIAARRDWHPPADALLASMRLQPVSGWQTNTTDLGLPAGEAASSRLGIAEDPHGPQPLIGTSDNRAYLLASSGVTPHLQWWLAGIDANDGQPLFPAVRLGAVNTPPHCFLNGDSSVLCLSANDDLAHTAWTVDAQSGALVYTGPTDLRIGYATLAVRQHGGYAIAVTADQGVYGIGPRAETTWFVPGAGPSGRPNPGALATQEKVDPREWDTTVFSVRDGRAVAADVPDGAKLHSTVVYPGGFAAAVDLNGKSLGVMFFDASGKRVAGIDGASLGDTPLDLPVVRRSGEDASLYTPRGDRLFDIPDHRGGLELRGATLFVNENASSAFPMWRQYDVTTGEAGQACDFNMPNYLGTDGSAIVFAVTNPQAGLAAKARDRTTCETLWALPAQAHSFAAVWRVGNTLVRLSDDGTELTSLVAPKN